MKLVENNKFTEITPKIKISIQEQILLTPDQGKQLLGCGRNAIYKLMNERDFPVCTIGHKKYINRALLEKWAEKKCSIS